MMARVLLVLLGSAPALAQELSVDAGVLNVSVRSVARHETEPLGPTDNPSWALPAHARLEMEGPRLGTLEAVDIAAWKRTLAGVKGATDGCITRPLAALRKSLDQKDGAVTPAALVGCPDASPAFLLFATRVRFERGVGWLVLTQWMIENVSPSNRGLEWHFQGLTSDGKTFVTASIPARADGFPETEGELVSNAEAERLVQQATKLLMVKGPAALQPSQAEVTAVLRTVKVSK